MKHLYNILKIVWKPVRDFIVKNQFDPSFWGVFINPFWLSRRAIADKLKQNAHFLNKKTLDFGCGSQPYKRLLSHASTYIGVELDTPQNRKNKIADLFYNGHSIPLQTSSIDSILSTQTFEHLPNPCEILTEFHRILRPGGNLVLSIPLMWPEHETPYDFYRYTSFGIKSLLERHNFTIIKIEKTLPDIRMPAQIFLAWLYDSMRMGEKHLLVQALLSVILFSPITLLTIFLSKIFCKNEFNYLDIFVVAQKDVTYDNN